MKWFCPLSSLVIVILAGSLLSAGQPARSIVGRVLSISGGDTLMVLDDSYKQRKIRLYGIAAPYAQQPYGTLAREQLTNKVFGKNVRIELAAVDRKHGEVGRLFVGSRFINLEMVEEGLAWRSATVDKSGEFTTAQNEAIAGHRGLWADPHPVPPWQFRREK